MALVNAQKLAKSFGAEDIFDNITVSIPQRARIALVGPNGSGKTTLLNLLAHRDEPTDGMVTHARNVRIGYLPQRAELVLSGDTPLWDEMLKPFADLIRQETKLADLAAELEQNPDNADLLERYGAAQIRFEIADGYDYPVRIKQVLSGLGFVKNDFQRPISQLSGGQKTRALLAQLLLENPDLLILDEPTNHLDINAIEWLEGWLKDFNGALLLVSHDRYFMDRSVSFVWELIFGRLEEYRGNYSHYVLQREERHTHMLAEYKRQQEFIAKEQDFIQRNIAGQNTRQAQGRRKRLERYLKDQAIARPRDHRLMRLNLHSRKRSGDKVLMTENLVLGYHDDKIPLFTAPDITLLRGECAALIGPNGTGKSTFMKTILNQIAPLDGEVTIGASVEVGYFAQAHEELNPQNSILDEILTIKNMPLSETRTYLGSFLFKGDDVYKPISTLSGGERGRVALAKLALSGANLLLLDEPTNHLDIPSQEILEAVLADFAGTILLISHDRYLIRNLATQVWKLEVPRKGKGQTELLVYEGPYEEYLTWRDARKTQATPAKQKQRTAQSSTSEQPRKPRLSPRERQKRLVHIEGLIHQSEVEMVEISGQLEVASSAGEVGKVTELGAAYTQAEANLEQLMGQWEELLADE